MATKSLTRESFDAVLEMLSGGYPSEVYRRAAPAPGLGSRQRACSTALPGSRLLAIRNGGTIPDPGQFRVYLPDGKTLLGTLDEEFVYETRVGDVFTLGSGTWRVTNIDRRPPGRG